MKFQLFLFFVLFNFIFSFDEGNIIKLPNKKGEYKNIPTRKGYINYQFDISSGEEFMASFQYAEYIFKGIKINNNSETIRLGYPYSETDSGNEKICRMFYEYNYIDNLIYAIDSKYKYFGGLPIHKDSSFEKFTFNNKIENVTEIKIELNNGTKFVKNIDYNFEITEEKIGLVYMPKEIFSFLYDLFLKDYKIEKHVRSYMYYPEDNEVKMDIIDSDNIFIVNNKQKKLFPNIWFKIGNKKFLFNAYSAIHEERLYIIKGYNSFVFGQDFLQIFDIREFNITSGEINLYTNNIKPHIKIVEEKNNLKKKNNKEQGLSFISYAIIIFISVITITTLYFHRKYNKKIKIDYYNYYYNV